MHTATRIVRITRRRLQAERRPARRAGGMRLVPLALALGLTAALATPARTQTSTTPGAFELTPTYAAIGAKVSYAGDDNGNASARLEWRPAGSGAWQAGVEMTRITNRRFAGSVFWLAADTPYDVRAVIADPDGGGTATATVRTRAEPVDPVPLRTWWVSTTGNDANAGSALAPLRTLQAAAGRVTHGDEIRVRPGIYYESIDATVAGTPAQPIQLVADGPGVVLDGSDPASLNRTDWRGDGGGVFSIPFSGVTRLVAADSTQRLYRQASLADLRAGANGVPQGWVIESGRLWVRLEDGSSPAGHDMHVARLDQGIVLDLSYWRVRGFEVRHYGTTVAACGIYLRGGSSCRVSENVVHTIGGKGIYLRVLAADNLIERNRIEDPRIGGWPWAAMKAHEEEIQGISNRGGRGNVIRSNIVRGFFDGIDLSGGETDEAVGADCDVYGNTVTGVADDALEPESISGINVRVWDNRIDDVFNGVSIAPNLQGPTYVLYNTITNYRRGGLKFSISSAGETWFVHNTIVSSVAGTAALHPTGPYSNLHFRNNILVGTGSAAVSDDAGESQAGCDFNGDLVHSTGATLFRWKNIDYSTIAALRSATGFEASGRSGDPGFVSPASGDYTLAAGSPAIDGALHVPGINDRFLGSAPDMGAHEFGGGGADVQAPAAILDLRTF